MNLMKAFLGPKAMSKPGEFGWPELWGAVRDGLLFALIMGGITVLEQVDVIDFGPTLDAIISSVIYAGTQFLRRIAKDYSPPPTFPPSN